MLLRVKKLVLACAIFSTAQFVLAAPVLVKSEQDIYEYKFENGFRVVLAPNQKENKVYMNTIYFTGSLHDPKGKGGLAHLLEHLAFKGTTEVKGDEFQRLLDQYTLNNNASTNYYSTRYTNMVRPDQNALDQIIYLEAQRMDKLVLQEKFVPTEIEIVRREREIRLDQPFSVMLDEIWKTAYGNEHLGRLPIGDLAELTSITMPELEQFYKTYYAPNNAVMVVAGKFDVQEILKTLDKNFADLKPKVLPQDVAVPLLDSTKMQQREFKVEKGSDLAQFNIYLNGKNPKIQNTLSLVPYLYTMEPSGHLYKNMVETGISTSVPSTTWLERDFNLVLLGAVYSPTQDASKVKDALIKDVEQGQAFTEAELKRIKNIAKNAQKTLMANSAAVGAALTEYVVSHQGDWAKFFSDQQELDNLSLNEVNQTLSEFLTAQHRVTGHILPTPEDQKKAQQQQSESNKTLDDTEQKPEPLKDPSIYRAETKTFVASSAKLLQASEQKAQRGQLNNEMKYAFYPVSTRDERIYATLNIDFGDEKSLFNQATAIDLMTYLLLRGSDQYSLQDITDKSIELDGQVTADAKANTLSIDISARKENFTEYFNFVIELLKQPKFEQKEFDLIRTQSLQGLDRPYTEPDVVAGLVLSRLTEQYQAGDLRYHFEPDLAKKELEQVSNDQIKALYKQFFAMNHAQITFTGEFDPTAMQKLLADNFTTWTTSAKYQAIAPDYKQYAATKIHALAEQREFGHYQSVLTLPIGAFHQDVPALLILSNILGESQLSSRLAQELREKKALVYGFGSGLSLNDQKEVGALTIGANYTAGRSEQVSQSIHKVLQELIAKGVTEQELEAAKTDIMKQRATMLEDERKIHRVLANQLSTGKTMKDRELRDQEIAKLTTQDIHAVIKKYIKPEQLIEVMADQYGQKAE